jgi:hypothetical protein
MEMERKPVDTLKEIQNILLRNNSEMKSWYKVYSRKVEVHKCDESFAMTLKQFWRFMRDTHLVTPNSTISHFNRLYNQGAKNHFVLLGIDDKLKFDSIFQSASQNQQTSKRDQLNKSADISEDEDESEAIQDQEYIPQGIEDIHDPFKIVLQRQFFEAIVRATASKFSSCGQGLTDLSSQLEFTFKNNLVPLAVKNKSKS